MPPRSTRSSVKTGNSITKPKIKKEEIQVENLSNKSPSRKSNRNSQIKKESRPKSATPPSKANTSKKRKREETETALKEEDESKPNNEEPSKRASQKRASKKTSSSPKIAKPMEADLNSGMELAKSLAANPTDVSSPSKAKANSYGLTPGQSPYPKFPHPTREECEEVHNILSKHHGNVRAPTTMPKPRLDSSGCGEVPSVLDALIRTRLSAATNGANSSRAFRGLVEKFGVIKQGVGKGSVNWERVRTANNKDVFEAIKSGGLAAVKSKDIQLILNMVLEENEEARKSGSKQDKVPNGVLSLDHLHRMGSEEAFAHLLRYPGIGPKTASCVLLFCMQRPSFAVDTHVFRLTRWLGWMPTDSAARAMAKRGETKSGQVTRNSTYAHLDVRIPDELKYGLHYLLIRHGKDCGWCSAKAGAAKRVGVCPLAKLMKGKGRAKGSAKRGEVKDEAEENEDDMEDEDNLESDADSVAVEEVVGMDSMKHE